MTRILVVDDEEAIREVLVEFLARHGYTAEAAGDGPAALALARGLKPQVVLLDVAMPGMDGIETLQRLRELSSEMVIIMISGHADDRMALRALDLGAYDFIQKPLDFEYLERTLLAKMVTLEADQGSDSTREAAHAA
ncbi:MAG TPA: response regulator, partial [Candidatus Polarisedimenticolia bacterium]|nr:response regulator [Candidatus Polarisedimenticolia bacterium]